MLFLRNNIAIKNLSSHAPSIDFTRQKRHKKNQAQIICLGLVSLWFVFVV